MDNRSFEYGAAASAPTAPGTPSVGYPSNGNAGTGTPATRPGQYWFHQIGEELRAVIVAGSLAPDSGTLTQVRDAISAMIDSAVAGALMPAGAIAYVSQTAVPTGWIKANGAAVSRTTYATLFAAIGTTFGVGDGSTTFNLPDLRGEFVRGYDDARGVDSGRVFGSAQDWSTAAPKQNTVTQLHGDGTTDALDYATNPSYVGFARASKTGETTTAGAADTGGSGTQVDVLNVATGDSETRPRNVALLAIIKY